MTLTALFYLVATNATSLGDANPLHVSVGGIDADVPRWLAAVAASVVAMFVLNQVQQPSTPSLSLHFSLSLSHNQYRNDFILCSYLFAVDVCCCVCVRWWQSIT